MELYCVTVQYSSIIFHRILYVHYQWMALSGVLWNRIAYFDLSMIMKGEWVEIGIFQSSPENCIGKCLFYSIWQKHSTILLIQKKLFPDLICFAGGHYYTYIC